MFLFDAFLIDGASRLNGSFLNKVNKKYIDLCRNAKGRKESSGGFYSTITEVFLV